jgi:hypothetical protein
VIDAIKRLRNRDGSPTKSWVANKEEPGFFAASVRAYAPARNGRRRTSRSNQELPCHNIGT